MHEYDVHDWFGFTADDLAANARGVLSGRQRDLLNPDNTTIIVDRGIALMSASFFLLCPLTCVFSVIQAGQPAQTTVYYGLLGVGLVAVGGGAVLAVRTLRAEFTGAAADRAALRQDVAHGVVLAADAIVVTDTAGEHVYAQLDDGQLLMHDGLTGFGTGELLRVYYTPYAAWIVSVERL